MTEKNMEEQIRTMTEKECERANEVYGGKGNEEANEDFTQDQLHEIETGLIKGLDVSVYVKPELLAIQMHQIRLGLEAGLPVERYARADYDWFQMEEIRKGLAAGLDVDKYADPSVPFETMRQIRKGLVKGLDLSSGLRLPAAILKEMRKAMLARVSITKYIREGYREEQLRQIRIALEKGIDIDPWLSLEYRGDSIREIRHGLESKVDVSLYAKLENSWQQMREIRLGLEKRLDVEYYKNPLYSWQQMREIRLGLEEGLSVERYASLMYTEREMYQKRRALLKRRREMPVYDSAVEKEYDKFSVIVSVDEMEAMIVLQTEGAKPDKEAVLSALGKAGVTEGVRMDILEEIAQGRCRTNAVAIARGSEPQKGRDGWYEYFFRTDIKKKPRLLEDGSVDYLNMDWFEIVSKGQRIALYHSAQEGVPGTTVTGKPLPAQKGRELKLLTGKGFVLMPDRKTYVAEIDGKIELKPGRIEISSLLILDEVNLATGNINFNASVYVKGNVGGGVSIRAKRDILIAGSVEAAVLEAGGDIFLKMGSNGAGQGHIRAEGDVLGRFFESANVYAGGDIRANYCLNCELHAENRIEISGRNGMLAGGRNYAAMGIRVFQAGNQAGLATILKLGRREGFAVEEMALSEKEKEARHEIQLLKAAYYDFQEKYPVEARNTNPVYLKLENAVYTKEVELGGLLKQIEELEKEKERFRQAKLVVKGTMFEGVSVEINGLIWQAKQVNNVTLKKQDGKIIVYR